MLIVRLRNSHVHFLHRRMLLRGVVFSSAPEIFLIGGALGKVCGPPSSFRVCVCDIPGKDETGGACGMVGLVPSLFLPSSPYR